MTHKFDINHKSKLDNPKRREMLPVNEILTQIGLKSEERFADIGCGIGYFSIPSAELVGSKGTVYALDISKDMLDEVNKRIAEKNIGNIQTVMTGEYDFVLDDKTVSYAFMCTVLHEIEDRPQFLNEAKRILITGGKVAVIEWIKKETDWGPPVGHRVDSNDMKQELEDCGFENISYVELNNYFYLMLGTRL